MKENPAAGLTPYQWKKGQSGNVHGRVAGFKHYAAELFAHMIEAPINDDGQLARDGEHSTPFAVMALNRYMSAVLNGKWKGTALNDFVQRVLPELDKIDSLLSNQKTDDLKYMRYLVNEFCFDEQQAVLATKKPLVVVICGRRAGKTVDFAANLIKTAISHEKGDCLYVGRTSKSAYDIIWQTLIDILKYIRMPYKQNLTDQTLEFNAGPRIFVKGSNTKQDVENMRGLGLRLAIVDECQSQPHDKLKMLVEEILGPATKDYEWSQIVLGGTPSRVQGNYAEEKYAEASPHTARFNWNMSVNPHMPNHDTVLEDVLKEKGWSKDNQIWRREYRGEIGVYDTEAMVFRLQPANYFREDALPKWIASQPVADIFLVGGLDYGFDDFDSAAIIMASVNKPERFELWEYKGNRTGTADFAGNIKRGMAQVLGHPLISKLPNRILTWYCDTEGLGKKITYDLAQQFGLSVQPAYQGQQDLMVEMLQDDVREGRFKVREPQTIDGKEICTEFETETRRIVFERNENDELTRRIDDAIYHPEIMKSILYGMRYVWLKSKVKAAGTT